MKITKYEHACLVVEEQGKRLIVDPGGMTRDMGSVTDVVAVVFTHVHFDHFDDKQMASILAANPDVQFFGTDEVAKAAKVASVTPVHHGETQAVGPFQLQFYGAKHALVTGAKPDNQNVGVLINERLYYPGDSFDAPDAMRPEIVALPVSGPWLKTGESIEFLKAVRPAKLAFPTHDAMLSPDGANSTEKWVSDACQELGITLQILQPGASVEV